MRRRTFYFLFALVLIAVVVGGALLLCASLVTRTWAEYRAPESAFADLLADDRPENKVTSFDPDLVDRRPLGQWLINKSQAVIKLHVPVVKPIVFGMAIHPPCCCPQVPPWKQHASPLQITAGAGPSRVVKAAWVDCMAPRQADLFYRRIGQRQIVIPAKPSATPRTAFLDRED